MDDDRARRRREPPYRVLLRAHRPSEVFLRASTQVQRPSEAPPDEVPRPRRPE
ncbi:hypothetical protein [Pseudonocardia kunmingensis]|uniref:hypothetical protein n=1 Tax=Pseudonocardia kunmingensis TaxID=630975 RepID=UPI00147948E7|nr:hypothetical protein [Pseudonocardia kunmingensis]